MRRSTIRLLHLPLSFVHRSSFIVHRSLLCLTKTPRMCLVVNLHQLARAEVDISLGCGEAGMPQHLLNLPDICSPIQKMCGKAMAQAMRAHLSDNARSPRILLDQSSNASAGQSSSPHVDEEGCFAFRISSPIQIDPEC